MWVDKYRPTSTKGIIGQQTNKSNVKKLTHWLQNWHTNNRAGVTHKEGAGTVYHCYISMCLQLVIFLLQLLQVMMAQIIKQLYCQVHLVLVKLLQLY